MGPNAELKRVAEGVVANCRAGQDRKNLDDFYAGNAVSVEAFAPDGGDRTVSGLEAIRNKHDWWENTMEELGSETEGPFYHGDDRFSVIFTAKVRNRESGETIDMRETATYHVRDGKVVREEFFYAM